MSAFFNDAEVLWVAWIVVGGCVVWSTIRALSRLRMPNLRLLLRDEHGSGYTLSYVMTVPLYLIMVFTFVELSLVLIAKVGTVYSGFAAARSGIVWNTAANETDADDKIQQAAIQTMAPFASGLTEMRIDKAASWQDADNLEAAFMKAYDQHRRTESKASSRYVRAKYRYAKRTVQAAIEVEPKQDAEVWDEDIVVTISYDYPFTFPLLGRFLMAQKKNGVFIRPITSTVRLQNETPKNTEKRLGISYASP